MIHLMYYYSKGPMQCASCVQHLRNLLVAVSTNMEVSKQQWGSSDMLRGCGLQMQGPKKRCRVDPHLRKQLAQEELQAGVATSSGLHAKALKLGTPNMVADWEHKELCNVWASYRLGLARPGPLFLTFDGARIGNPGKEMMLWLITKLKKTDQL